MRTQAVLAAPRPYNKQPSNPMLHLTVVLITVPNVGTTALGANPSMPDNGQRQLLQHAAARRRS
jgi:hypothetical protein